ncbi:MAG: tRNA lysidine(34) synthetase TilS [Pseudomonadota bacterium]
MNLTSNRLLEILQGLPAANRYHLAFSGGLDSTVLLHLLAEVRDRLPGSLHALHIHHGLQSDADAWGLHCRQFCEALSIPYNQLELGLTGRQGESLEALARDARYAALAAAMGKGELLLTAQHQDDQAETLLLQLLRGSGPAGLAAMPGLLKFGQGWLARPLLDFPRAALEAYAREHRLSWVDDPSNQNLRFDRNYIRHRVMPLLQQRWPSAATTIARSARLSGELQGLVDEQAAQDLASAQGAWPGTLSVSVLRSLSPARRRSLLRHWIREQGGVMPGSRHLLRIEEECLAGREDAQPLVHWRDVEVRRFRDGLFLLRPLPPHDASQVIPWPGRQALRLPAEMGELVLEPAEAGISKDKWLKAKIEVRFRQGGERCIPAASNHHRALKKLFQEWAVPPWNRERIPLIYLDNQLAVIPGYVSCEPFKAMPTEEAVMPHWRSPNNSLAKS